MTKSSIVIDSSALIAIVFSEPEAPVFAQLIGNSKGHVSASIIHETEVVVLRRVGADKVPRVRVLLSRAQVTVHAFDDHQAVLATQAYLQFGKGRHPAQLGLLDCAAYALAKSLDAPLLYKGNDFAQTDIVSAVTAG